jgi:hypothetical protein
LTKESEDRIVALSGIARQVAVSGGLQEGDYLAGLWKHLSIGFFMAIRPGGRPFPNWGSVLILVVK